MILFIDNDVRFAELIRTTFNRESFCIVNSIDSALTEINHNKISLVFVNPCLPDFTESGLIKRLNKLGINNIIIGEDCAACKDAYNMGASDFICKDISIDNLIVRVGFSIKKFKKRQRFTPIEFEEIKACFAHSFSENVLT